MAKTIKSHSGIWIIIVAAVVLEAISCIMYFTSRNAIRNEADQRAKTELRKSELEINVHAIEMETAAKTLVLLAEKYIDKPDSIFTATHLAVSMLTKNTSMAVAFVPDYYPKYGRYFEVCSSRITKDSIYTRQIGSAEHDYTLMEWWQNGFVHDSCWWSEPYLDDSGSRTFVVSCSCPVRDRKGKVVAVVCIDLSLSDMKNLSDYLQVYPNSLYSIRSSTGMEIVPIPDTVPGRKYISYDEEIDATGWHIEIIIPEDELFKDLNHTGRIVGLLMLIGLALLIFIIIHTSRNLVKLVSLSNQQERMESELSIARSIQMAMLPTRFPPFPDYPNLSAYGVVIPAKEVGGDLFDFYIRENKLLFCVGDVSGKGVPASLVMAVTRSLFRSFTSYLNSPAQIVTQMNEPLSGEANKQNMFVTLFLGVLDMQTGELRYCNAGHDAPYHLFKGEEGPVELPCDANLPLGVLQGLEFTEQSTHMEPGEMLFLYTDGLTEAENISHALFGEERIRQTLSRMPSDIGCQQMIATMQGTVQTFVGGAEQSDDLTLFAFRFLEKSTGAVAGEKAPAGVSHHSLVMRNDIQQIPTLAEWVESLGIPEELNMPINLALEEAVSNVMLYAYPDSNSGRVLVEAEKSDKRVVFTISDSGIPFDPTQKEEPDITQAAEDRPIGGLGIFLVRQIMDEIAYERKDGKNILTLLKNL
jgi:sigma-B regulation protein RsbU (phosphoserine phosphatase)